MKLALSSGAAVLALLTFFQAARADPIPPEIVGSVTPLSGGLYQYQYTITNQGAGTYLQGFYLQAVENLSSSQYAFYQNLYSSSPTSPFLNVTASGHFAYNPPLYWTTTEGPEGGLTQGQSSTFSFTTPFQPGTVPYTLQYYTPSQDEGYLLSHFGNVVGPVDNLLVSAVSAPEPASCLLLGLGVLGLAVFHGWRATGRLLLSVGGRAAV